MTLFFVKFNNSASVIDLCNICKEVWMWNPIQICNSQETPYISTKTETRKSLKKSRQGEILFCQTKQFRHDEEKAVMKETSSRLDTKPS